MASHSCIHRSFQLRLSTVAWADHDKNMNLQVPAMHTAWQTCRPTSHAGLRSTTAARGASPCCTQWCCCSRCSRARLWPSWPATHLQPASEWTPCTSRWHSCTTRCACLYGFSACPGWLAGSEAHMLLGSVSPWDWLLFASNDGVCQGLLEGGCAAQKVYRGRSGATCMIDMHACATTSGCAWPNMLSA